jgi:hypothetical protein
MELNTMHDYQGDSLLQYLDGNIKIDDDLVLIRHFINTTYLPVFESELVTYEDMKSSGNLNLIKDLDLQNSLRAYMRRVISMNNNYIPGHVSVKKEYRDYLFKYIDARLMSAIRNKPDLTDFYFDKEGLFQDSEIKSFLRKSINIDGLLNNYYTGYLRYISDARKLIKEAIML